VTAGGAEGSPAPQHATRARVVLRRRRLTTARLRERVRDAFWIIPSGFLMGAILLTLVTREIDRSVGTNPGDGPWWVGTQADAAAVLETIATAMLTFLGVVFSITLVALQLASQQFSPRVTRTFVRSTTTKVALGIFIATFTCALLALSSVERGAAADAASPVVSVSVALILVGASLVVFIAFVNNTTRLIRIAHIIGAVADETGRAIDDNYPTAGAYTSAPAPHSPASSPAHLVHTTTVARWFKGGGHGLLLAVDVDRLVELARTHDCLLRVVPRIGEYLPAGSPVVEVHGEVRRRTGRCSARSAWGGSGPTTRTRPTGSASSWISRRRPSPRR
jgi:uncharacterized membrane protein